MSADGPNTNPAPANGRDGRLLRVPNRRHTCGNFEGGPDYVDPPAIVARRPEDRGDPDHRGGTA